MTIGVIGLGLIGGSFAKAATRAGHRVAVWNRTRTTSERAVADGAAAAVLEEDMTSTAGSPDLYLISLPPDAVVPWIDAHQSAFKPGAVVVDATGVKGTICAALRKYAYDDTPWTFVGGHPMAGKEVAGYANATPDLFSDASMILTPYPSCGRGPLDMLEAFFKELGFGRVVFTTPEHHDEMIALTSQLAHVVSSAYIQDPLAKDHAGFSAGSFYDMTRVARLNPDIWTNLFLANKEALSSVLGGLIERLAEFKSALDAQDAPRLRDLLEKGRMVIESMPPTYKSIARR